jgi:DNA-binding PadR family transcriptional regulator
LIKSRWVVADTGRKRKYYRVVAAGKKQLKAERQQWEVVDSMLRDLWGGLSKCSI